MLPIYDRFVCKQVISLKHEIWLMNQGYPHMGGSYEHYEYKT